MWLQVMWLQFDVVRDTVGVGGGRFGAGLGPKGLQRAPNRPQIDFKSTSNCSHMSCSHIHRSPSYLPVGHSGCWDGLYVHRTLHMFAHALLSFHMTLKWSGIVLFAFVHSLSCSVHLYGSGCCILLSLLYSLCRYVACLLACLMI